MKSREELEAELDETLALLEERTAILDTLRAQNDVLEHRLAELRRQSGQQLAEQRDELADVWRVALKAQTLLTDLIVARRKGKVNAVRPAEESRRRPGRPAGSTHHNREGFAERLVEAYQALPHEARTREEVARALGVKKRTFTRYLERWAIPWPPVSNNHSHAEATWKR